MTPTIDAPRHRGSGPPHPIATTLPRPTAESGTNLTFFLLALYLFLLYSRVHEFALPGARPMMVVMPVLLVTSVVSGNFPRLVLSAPGILLLGLTAGLVLATPFSMWKGGSVEVLRNQWLPSFTIFFAAGALLQTGAQIRRVVNVIAYSVCFVLAITPLFAEYAFGRLGLRGTLGNPNDLANHLLFGLPFLVAMMWTERGWRKLLAIAAVIPFALTLIRTGSRGGFLCAALVMAMVFFNSTAAGKLKLFAGGMLLCVAALAAAPGVVVDRYLSMFTGSGATPYESQEERAARESATSRRALLKSSIWITLRHPVLGVGPGQFALANNQAAISHGGRPPWLQTHNAYTQVSSEAGVPAFLCYVGLLIWCVRATGDVRRMTRARPDLAWLDNAAFALRTATLAYMVSAFFTSIGYTYYLPTLAGLTWSLRRLTPEPAA